MWFIKKYLFYSILFLYVLFTLWTYIIVNEIGIAEFICLVTLFFIFVWVFLYVLFL